MSIEPDYIVGFESKGIDKIADFDLTLGEEFKPFIVLTGDNGAGKTFLLECLFKGLWQHNMNHINMEREKRHSICNFYSRYNRTRGLQTA